MSRNTIERWLSCAKSQSQWKQKIKRLIERMKDFPNRRLLQNRSPQLVLKNENKKYLF